MHPVLKIIQQWLKSQGYESRQHCNESHWLFTDIHTIYLNSETEIVTVYYCGHHDTRDTIHLADPDFLKKLAQHYPPL